MREVHASAALQANRWESTNEHPVSTADHRWLSLQGCLCQWAYAMPLPPPLPACRRCLPAAVCHLLSPTRRCLPPAVTYLSEWAGQCDATRIHISAGKSAEGEEP